MNRLREAAAQGNIDRLYAQFEKAVDAVEKAQNAVLDACDTLDAILVEATAIGGKVAQIVPQHIKNNIRKLTDIAEQNLGNIVDGDQSSLSQLQDMVGNIPYRELRQPSAADRREQISMQPNLAAGPQSQISESSLEDAYETMQAHLYEKARRNMDPNNFDFEDLRESELYGNNLDPESMALFNRTGGVIPRQERTKLQQQYRERINDDFFQDSQEVQHLQEDYDPNTYRGPRMDFSKMRAFGDKDGQPLALPGVGQMGTLKGMDMKTGTLRPE